MQLVMLVDDDELLRDLLQLRLEVEGWDVVTAADGAAAIALLEGGAGPDVIVLDLMMPVMDGMRFMHALAERVPNPPAVVVLSALDKPEIRSSLLGAGAREVVRKPVELQVLLCALRAASGG